MLVGNSNSDHEYGTSTSTVNNEEKYELLEFLKTL